MPSQPIENLLNRPYKRWYQYGRRSLKIMYKRFRNRHPWGFKIRMAAQRVRKGHDDSQLWSLNHALATLIVAGLNNHLQNQHGYPSELATGENEGWDKWEAIMLDMRDGFQAWLDKDGWFNNEPEAEAQYNKAMVLFAEWFPSLWD